MAHLQRLARRLGCSAQVEDAAGIVRAQDARSSPPNVVEFPPRYALPELRIFDGCGAAEPATHSGLWRIGTRHASQAQKLWADIGDAQHIRALAERVVGGQLRASRAISA